MEAKAFFWHFSWHFVLRTGGGVRADGMHTAAEARRVQVTCVCAVAQRPPPPDPLIPSRPCIWRGQQQKLALGRNLISPMLMSCWRWRSIQMSPEAVIAVNVHAVLAEIQAQLRCGEARREARPGRRTALFAGMGDELRHGRPPLHAAAQGTQVLQLHLAAPPVAAVVALHVRPCPRGAAASNLRVVPSTLVTMAHRKIMLCSWPPQGTVQVAFTPWHS